MIYIMSSFNPSLHELLEKNPHIIMTPKLTISFTIKNADILQIYKDARSTSKDEFVTKYTVQSRLFHQNNIE